MRVLLFTGKGGVGKTSVAAATALRCADAGLRTLVISTDPAHSLSDSFAMPLGTEPTPITHSLWGQQLDAQERMEESWGDIQAYLVEVFNWAGVEAIEAEELAVIPGLDEVFALGDIKTHAESGEWDVLVVDCAPTAETIRLLSLPDILSLVHGAGVPHGPAGEPHDRAGPVAGHEPAGRRRRGLRRQSSRFYDRLDGVKEILADPERTSVRLVVNPERMVIAEARRTYTYLSLFGYRVDAVVANRLLPDEITDPWFEKWKASHAEHLATIDEAFSPLPVLRAAAGQPGAGRPQAAARASPARSTATPTPPPCCTTRTRCGSRRRATTTCSPRSCPSPTATTWRWGGAATSSSCASARTGGRSCCPTRCGVARSPTPSLRKGKLRVTFGPG